MKLMVCAYGRPEEWQYLQLIEKLKIGIELQSYGLNGIKSKAKWERIFKNHQHVRQHFNGPLALHGPFIGITYDQDDCILREAIQKRMDETFKVVESIQPEVLVLHAGYSEEVEKFHLESKWLSETADYWSYEIQRYAQIGVTVVLENVLEKTPAPLLQLHDAINHPNLKLCLDVGHANIWSKLHPAQWVEQLGTRIYHIHLHDNHGADDEHLPIGEGTIDFDSIFMSIKKYTPETVVSLEVDAEKDRVMACVHDVIAKFF